MPTEHAVPVADGQAVSAVHHEAPTDDWLVFCHGFLSDKTGSYEGRCRRAVAEGYNAVRFDFRGCGESDGVFIDQTLSSRLADLQAVVDYFAPDSYAVFGSSFGGKVAFHTAVDDDRVESVATRAPVTYNETFADVRTAVARDGEYVYETGDRLDQRFFEDFGQYEFERVESSLDRPVAIFHGAADDSVPFDHSVRATAELDTDVLLQKYRGEGHRFSETGEARLRDQLFDWLARR